MRRPVALRLPHGSGTGLVAPRRCGELNRWAESRAMTKPDRSTGREMPKRGARRCFVPRRRRARAPRTSPKVPHQMTGGCVRGSRRTCLPACEGTHMGTTALASQKADLYFLPCSIHRALKRGFGNFRSGHSKPDRPKRLGSKLRSGSFIKPAAASDCSSKSAERSVSGTVRPVLIAGRSLIRRRTSGLIVAYRELVSFSGCSVIFWMRQLFMSATYTVFSAGHAKACAQLNCPIS